MAIILAFLQGCAEFRITQQREGSRVTGEDVLGARGVGLTEHRLKDLGYWLPPEQTGQYLLTRMTARFRWSSD
jgi:hypothetical protein